MLLPKIFNSSKKKKVIPTKTGDAPLPPVCTNTKLGIFLFCRAAVASNHLKVHGCEYEQTFGCYLLEFNTHEKGHPKYR